MNVLGISLGVLALIIIAVLVFYSLRDPDSHTAGEPESTPETTVDATVELPISVQGALNLGSLLVEVGYDTGMLELQSVGGVPGTKRLAGIESVDPGNGEDRAGGPQRN